MKIFYAAGNRLGSYYQLKRFLSSTFSLNHDIRIAAYKNSLQDLNTDYTLDCLLNFTSNSSSITFNGNYGYYSNEIKRFNPDLIISDFDPYTSIIAIELNITLWQYSPTNLYYALSKEQKREIEVRKHNTWLLEESPDRNEYIKEIFAASDRNFVLSHVCDCETPIPLINGFEYVRPSFVLGTNNNTADTVIATAQTNMDTINDFKNKNAILFSPYTFQHYNRLQVKDINNETEYSNSLEDCNTFITDGTAAFTADAFYNQKYCISLPRHNDLETLITAYANQHCNIGSMEICDPKPIKISINEDVKFITEHLGER